MNANKLCWTLLAFGVALGLCACGAEEPVVGTADAGGTAGRSGTPACPGYEVSRLAACWQPDLGAANPSSEWWVEGAGYVVPNLTVVNAVEPNTSLCEGSFPIWGPDAWEYGTSSRAAWDLEDESGRHWIVQFGIDGITPDVLTPGDRVDLKHAPSVDSEGGVHGFVSLERHGLPAVLLIQDHVPNFASIPDLAIEPDRAACPLQEARRCQEPRAVRVTMNGESVVIPMRDGAEVGGFVAYNNFASDNRSCQFAPPYSRELQLGIYVEP